MIIVQPTVYSHQSYLRLSFLKILFHKFIDMVLFDLPNIHINYDGFMFSFVNEGWT